MAAAVAERTGFASAASFFTSFFFVVTSICKNVALLPVRLNLNLIDLRACESIKRKQICHKNIKLFLASKTAFLRSNPPVSLSRCRRRHYGCEYSQNSPLQPYTKSHPHDDSASGRR